MDAIKITNGNRVMEEVFSRVRRNPQEVTQKPGYDFKHMVHITPGIGRLFGEEILIVLNYCLTLINQEKYPDYLQSFVYTDREGQETTFWCESGFQIGDKPEDYGGDIDELYCVFMLPEER